MRPRDSQKHFFWWGLKMGEIKMEKILESIYRDRLEQLGLISSALVHEIQTPLIIIRGRAESLLRHEKKDIDRDLREISKECEHLMRLLDAMLFMSSPKKTKNEKINLKNLVTEALLFFEKTCFEQGISIRSEIEDNLEVESDASRIKSILISFILNAIESFEGTDVPVRNILIHSTQDKGKCHLVVSDTGVGMSEEVKSKIFKETFYSTKSHKKSSGLGLTMAAKMASDIGAKIEFFSQQGKGSSFEIVF